MSTKGSTGNIDAKREEFRKYLEKEGVLEYLTKQLVKLYEEADKPSNALDYLKNNFNGKEAEVAQLKAENLDKENQELKERIKSLESQKTDLELVIKELQKTTSNGILPSASSAAQNPVKSPKDNTEEKAEMDEDEPMETVEDQSNTQASEDKVDQASSENVVEGTEGDTEDAKKLSPDNTDLSADTKQNEGTTDNADTSGTEAKSNAEAEESAAM